MASRGGVLATAKVVATVLGLSRQFFSWASPPGVPFFLLSLGVSLRELPVRKPCSDCDAEEEWRPVPDPRFVDKYEVSNLGNVRSVDRVVWDRLGRSRRVKGKSIFLYICDFGYHRYTLNYGGRRVRQSMAAHRLVAMAFIGPAPSEKHEVMHLDHDPPITTWAISSGAPIRKMSRGPSMRGVSGTGIETRRHAPVAIPTTT